MGSGLNRALSRPSNQNVENNPMQSSNHAFRHHVKPGISGWARVNGYRGETRGLKLMQKRVEFDVWYINNWSLWLDVKILMRTAMIAFAHHAAY
ncbi:sugar transferase [Bradyrhizobium sp. Arg237L]|uniref:sugar transferase n=1 Tax=Bradyrhizobium sp. Arg237L TaxID=3003352 RepID=UPI00249DB66C|nr:sugar transferase [Bradyrhizobium sp. Arg237L]MDI4238195.1 sugar transferase [Bradyrhizobium sp. Arg237L]